MSLKVFLKFVQIYTKGNSVLPFLLGTLYAQYHYNSLHLGYLLIFFIAMILFNMFVDAHDNYLDYRQYETLNKDPNHPHPNLIHDNNININLVRFILVTLVGISAAMGLYIAFNTGQAVLWLGIFSFAVGYLYSGGPIPISSTPFGEFFSGFTMGSVIFIIAVYINVYELVTFNWNFVSPILVSSGLAATSIAAILLANNTADYEKDLKLGRHTIVSFLGVKKSLYFMALIYTFGFICQIVAVLKGFLPIYCLLTLIFVPQLIQRIHAFWINPDKKKTFVPIAYNAIYLLALQVIGLFLGIIF